MSKCCLSCNLLCYLFRVFFNKHQTCGGLGVLPVSETAGALVDQDRSCELVGVAWDEKDGPVIKISHTM